MTTELTTEEVTQFEALAEKLGVSLADAMKTFSRTKAEIHALRNTGEDATKYGDVSIVQVFPNGGIRAKCAIRAYQVRTLIVDLTALAEVFEAEAAAAAE